jgi:site-specific recombinase XerD
MTKRIAHKLTIYRRHAASCPISDATKLDACDCPIWIHGKVRGKFVRESLQTRSLTSAISRKDDMLRGGGDDPHPGGIALVATQTPKDITLAFAAQEFAASKGRKASSTRELYTRAINHFVAYAHAHEIVLLRHVETALVRGYFAEHDRDWKRNTAQSRLIHLRVFFNYCSKARHWLQFTPTSDRDLNYSRGAAKSSERLPFTSAEVTAILAAVEKMPVVERDHTRALVLLLLYTGMRISDATFFERSSLTAEGNADYHVIKTRRPISLPPEVHPRVIDALAKLPASRVYFFQPDREDEYRDARAALRGGREFSELMPDYKSRVQEMTRLVKKALALAGLSGACHRFRDTFAINMLVGDGEKGADIYTVSKLLGHSDVKITDAHYVKLVPGYRERMSKSTRVLSYQFPGAA